MLDFGAFFAIYQRDSLIFLRMCKGVFDCLICVKKDALRLFYYSNRGNQSSLYPAFFYNFCLTAYNLLRFSRLSTTL